MCLEKEMKMHPLQTAVQFVYEHVCDGGHYQQMGLPWLSAFANTHSAIAVREGFRPLSQCQKSLHEWREPGEL